ncbi:MAG TPA: class I SAM-dependent methyltransferase [Roseiflexaceae bacterium]|nr:class I SAM-dependent methyltransferase [Roseiflexaceae bacterium]
MAVNPSRLTEPAVYPNGPFGSSNGQTFRPTEQPVTYTLPDMELTNPAQIERAVGQDHYHHRAYTDEASLYDSRRFTDSWGRYFNAFEQQQIFKLLNLKPGQSVLDAPVGTGRIGAYLAQQGLNVTGLDLTRNMMLQARRRSESANLAINFIEANARVLPFADNQFDGLISNRFFHIIPVEIYRPFILEMWRVLKPGGVLLVQFDSALAGGIMTQARIYYRKLVYGKRSRHFLRPGHIQEVFDGIENITLHGGLPVGMRTLHKLAPAAVPLCAKLTANGPRSFYANRLFVRAVKPSR